MYDDGTRLIKYENINGNWSTQLMGMFNTPLKYKRFSVSHFARTSYNNQNSLIYEQQEALKNTQKSFSVSDNANINYRSDLFDFGVNVSINYGNTTYSLQPERNQNPLSWGLGSSTTWYLPYNFTIESDINYTKRSGYTTGYNLPETIWNAAATKQLFNKNFGTGSLKLQIFDILKNRNNITASATTNGFRTSQINVIPSYFMCSFIYKFNFFPKSAAKTTEEDFPGRRWDGPGEPGSGGFRGPGSPF
jgi:hypothetical protein